MSIDDVIAYYTEKLKVEKEALESTKNLNGGEWETTNRLRRENIERLTIVCSSLHATKKKIKAMNRDSVGEVKQ